MLKFVHFDDHVPSPSYGKTEEEYMLSTPDYFHAQHNSEYGVYYKMHTGKEYNIRAACRQMRVTWKRHQPPKDIRGLYAFVVGGVLYTELLPRPTMDLIIEQVRDYFHIPLIKENLLLDMMNETPEKLSGVAYIYTMQDIKSVWYRKNRKWTSSKNEVVTEARFLEWKNRVTNPIAEECLWDFSEVFLEM